MKFSIAHSNLNTVSNPTKKIAIVYFSNSGVTAKLAESIKKGLQSIQGIQNIQVIEYCIDGKDIIEGRFDNPSLLAEFSECRAIIFGTPTYMGGVSAQFKAFCDSTSEVWTNQGWAGKLGAGFTSGTGLNGDQGFTLQYLSVFASQHGMLWLGLDTHFLHNTAGVNRLGCQLGVTAQDLGNSDVDSRDLSSAFYLGSRMGQLIRNL